jgi:hypothetical protein
MCCCSGGAAAGGEQQYSLRWNDFHSAMVSSFRRLRDEEDFVDVTLACAGATFTAHKVTIFKPNNPSISEKETIQETQDVE